ncbi:MAG: hypothetical protein JO115_21270 [Pseudonocardiales bacterium]|nr:hypothetical protein [Pseudonocardiales bacterium]
MTTPLPPGDYPTGQAPLRGTRPKEVEISFWLWIATFVLGVLGLSVTYSQVRAQMVDQALAQNPTVDQSMVERFTTAVFVVVLLVGAIELLFVFLMRAGRNWARIVLAVIGGIGVFAGLFGLVAGAGSVAGLLQLLLLIGAMVTMFLPAANAWFRPRRPGF